jgi:hypothetical protein
MSLNKIDDFLKNKQKDIQNSFTIVNIFVRNVKNGQEDGYLIPCKVSECLPENEALHIQSLLIDKFDYNFVIEKCTIGGSKHPK